MGIMLWRKNCESSSNCVWKSSADCWSIAKQVNTDRETVKENLKWRSWHEEGVCKNGLKGAHWRTLSVREILASKQITVLEHPPYSPNLVRNYFFLFPKIKEILKGRHSDDIGNNTMAALKAIPQNQFQNCSEGWTRRWHRCIAPKGEYFEGYHRDIHQWGM
jgi:hypothetical protein